MINKLDEIMKENKKYIKDGKLADYIPALAKANKDDIAIAIKDEEREYKLGDYEQKFTIQSISKVLGLMVALIENGREEVFKRVGCEGTQDPFNTMHSLTIGDGEKPVNPMINAGAILTTSLITGTGQEKFDKILDITRKAANNKEIDYSREVYLSERDTGDRNKSMGYIMRANGMIDCEDIMEDVLNPYFKQCSIEVTVVDIANIACFISSGCKGLDDYGKTDPQELSRIVMALMTTAGMYNYSGQYNIEVGLPSKSGVGGGIMACVPGKMGLGVYSPGLDENGNSKVGLEMMKDLSEQLKLNMYF